MNQFKKIHIIGSRIISVLLTFIFIVIFNTEEVKGKKVYAGNIIMQDGVICRLDPAKGRATLLGVTEFSGNSFPDTIVRKDKRYVINRIASYCLWPSRQNAPDSITLPNGIKYINERAFISMPYLKYVNLPEGLKTLGRYAFASTDLRRISFPESLKIIEEGAFEGCRYLSEVELSNVKYIENRAFMDCDIRELTIPSEEIVIGRDAFKNNDIFFLHFDKEAYSPMAVVMGFENIFGKSYIPWLSAQHRMPVVLYKNAPETMDNRISLSYLNSWGLSFSKIPAKDCLDVPFYFAFKEDGSDERLWKPDITLWPMTDPLQPVSHKSYRKLINPIRIRIDTTALKENNIKFKVLYNGEDITSKMRGDTIIITEGKKMNIPTDINHGLFNHIDVVRVNE